MAIALYPHNQRAYDAAVRLLEETGRAAVIHPTGTGKSYIGFALIEAQPQKQFLWLSPSDYIFQAQTAAIRRSAPELQMQNVSFLTYTRLIQLRDAELEVLCPDYIVLDEFHRCGARVWGMGVKRLLEQYPHARLLGLTATGIRYLDNARDMVEELFCVDGRRCVASEMTLGEALVRGILPLPRYITTLYGQQEALARMEQRVENSAARGECRTRLEALRRALNQTPDLVRVFARNMPDARGKYIIFCTDWTQMLQVQAQIPAWFGHLDEHPHVYLLYSGEPETDVNFQRFQHDNSDHLRLILCINRLNEGIHLPDLSGVILFRCTASPILYKQQIGRAMSAGGGRSTVIFDIVNNFENLASIGTIRGEMREAVLKLRRQKQESAIVAEDLHVQEQAAQSAALFRQLDALLSNTWESFYGEAAAYYHTHGDLLVPKRYVTGNGTQLGLWIGTQKAVYADQRKGRLTAEQIRRLEEIGMVWENRIERQWKLGLSHAEDYFDMHGDLLVPYSHTEPDGFPLGRWVSYMRSRREYLSAERIEQLESVGMAWDAYAAKWEQGFAKARDYFREHGNLQVPFAYKTEDGFALGSWIVSQKKMKLGTAGRSTLTTEQIRRLESIGMVWEDKFDKQWQTGYQAAREYYAQNGDLNIPYSYCTPDGFRLGRWIRRQRSAQTAPGRQTNSVMTPERSRKLAEIGMK